MHFVKFCHGQRVGNKNLCTIKVGSSLHVTFAKLAQICLTSRTVILTICTDHQVWPFLWPWILTQILTLTLCSFNLKNRRYIWCKKISQILIPFITKICVLIGHHGMCCNPCKWNCRNWIPMVTPKGPCWVSFASTPAFLTWKSWD